MQNALSTCMQESWDSGQFWVDYVAQRSWAFDAVFWRYIDPKFFSGYGEGDEYEARLELLDEDARDIGAFVLRKAKEAKPRNLCE
jgi:hypothetical protein